MILYNVTTNIQQEVEKDWVHWMKTHHIPDVMSTGLFKEFKFFRLLVQDDSGGTNYSTQFYADTMEDLNQYLDQHAPRLRADHESRFKNKQVSFRTLLEEVK